MRVEFRFKKKERENELYSKIKKRFIQKNLRPLPITNYTYTNQYHRPKYPYTLIIKTN